MPSRGGIGNERRSEDESDGAVNANTARITLTPLASLAKFVSGSNFRASAEPSGSEGLMPQRHSKVMHVSERIFAH